MALAFWSVGPDLIALYQQMGREAALGGAHHADMASMMALQSRMAVLQPVTLLSSLVSHAVLIGAIYRGVLHPEETRFGFVRFSSRELWLGLVMAVLYVGMFVALFAAAIVVAIPVAIVGFAARAAGGGAMAGLLCFLLVLAAIGVLVWLVLRLSLSLPLSFERNTFEIGESWSLTRGQAGKMFLVALAVVVIAWLAELTLITALVGGTIGFAAQGHWAALADLPSRELFGRILPLVPVVIVVGSLIGAPLLAILCAPFADIYRQLTAAGGEPA